MISRSFHSLSVALFFVVISLIFIFEGTGIRNGREVALYLIVVLPFFLYFPIITGFFTRSSTRYELRMPAFFLILSILFFIFSSISTLFSANFYTSFQFLMFYLSLFSIFFYAFHYKDRLSSLIIPFIYISSLVLASYSLFLPSIMKVYNFLIPVSGYQFVYPQFGLHNHLGDLLAGVLVANLFFLLKRQRTKLVILSTLAFFPFFLFSYSRSAYMSFIVAGVCLIAFFVKKKAINFFARETLVAGILLVLSFFFFAATASELKAISPTQFVTHLVSDTLQISSKALYPSRLHFIYQFLLSFGEKPYFGEGPGNFALVSYRSTLVPGLSTDSSHNLFLDVISENGIFAGLIFTIIILLILKKSTKNVFFFLFITLLLNFMTDYTHRIYSIFLLFMILGGIMYDEKRFIDGKSIIVIPVILFVAGQILLIRNLL